MASKVCNSECIPIVISDHAPLVLYMVLSPGYRPQHPWRLNSLLLPDSAFCDYISSAIDGFLTTNVLEDISNSLLWETLKAYLRGQIISHSSHLYKSKKAKQNELSAKIQALDRTHAQTP